MNIFHKVLRGAVPVFCLAFVTAFAAASVFTPTQTSDAVNTVTANINSNGYFVNIASDDVEVDLTTTPGGVVSTALTTVKTKTNAESGYWLYLSMENNTTALYLDGDDTRTDGEKVDSIGVTPSNQTTLEDNTWGYAVGADSEGIQEAWKNKTHTVVTNATTLDETFAGVPADGEMTLLQKTTSKNVESADDPNYTGLDIYYGVRATMERKTGSYSNTIVYTAIADPEGVGNFKLEPASYGRSARYEKMAWNDTLTVTTPLFTNMEHLGDVTITLKGGPENKEYECTNAQLASVNDVLTATCTLPAAYAGDYTINIDIEQFDLHYTGAYKYTVTWETISAMQEMTADVCASAGSVSASQRNAVSNRVPETYLLDIRGNNFGYQLGGNWGNKAASDAGVVSPYNYYRVRKLGDGNCWMAENLNLPQMNSQKYWDYDTNLTTYIETGGYNYFKDDEGHIGWTPKNNTQTSNSADSDGMNDHTYDYHGHTQNTADVVGTTGMAAEAQEIGTYYNYGAVTAKSGDANGMGAASGTAPNSICPKGWRLPGGLTGDKSFQNLMDKYGIGASSAANSTSSRQYPLSFIFSGYYDWVVRSGYSQLRDQGTYGFWWSSSVTDASNARSLNMNSSILNPQYNRVKTYGFNARCVSL